MSRDRKREGTDGIRDQAQKGKRTKGVERRCGTDGGFAMSVCMNGGMLSGAALKVTMHEVGFRRTAGVNGYQGNGKDQV